MAASIYNYYYVSIFIFIIYIHRYLYLSILYIHMQILIYYWAIVSYLVVSYCKCVKPSKTWQCCRGIPVALIQLFSVIHAPLQKPTNQSSRWATYKTVRSAAHFLWSFRNLKRSRRLPPQYKIYGWSRGAAHTQGRLRLKSNAMGVLWLACVVCRVSRRKKGTAGIYVKSERPFLRIRWSRWEMRWIKWRAGRR